jgi:hypothetical protein
LTQKIDEGKVPQANFDSNIELLTELDSDKIAAELPIAGAIFDFIFVTTKYFYLKQAEMKVVELGQASRLM